MLEYYILSLQLFHLHLHVWNRRLVSTSDVLLFSVQYQIYYSVYYIYSEVYVDIHIRSIVAINHVKVVQIFTTEIKR